MNVRACSLAVALLAVVGCHAPPAGAPASANTLKVNPSFPIGIEEARRELSNRAKRPRVTLDRPLVICGGFMDVGFGPWLMENTLRKHVDGQILCVTFATRTSLPNCRKHLVDAIEHDFGKSANGRTVEVDVIGQSLGGLIAVYSAMDAPELGTRINARRVFTICSPLQGATLATSTKSNWLEYQKDLRPGSALYADLRTAVLPTQLISYARLRDEKVGEEYAGLPGHPLWWVDTPADEDAHDRADFDPRILLDLVRRLRNEPPLTHEPATPLPG